MSEQKLARGTYAEPSQFEIDKERYDTHTRHAEPIFEFLRSRKNVKTAIEIAERKKQRRKIMVVLTIDGTGGEGTCKPMNASVTHSPLPNPGHKLDRPSKYEIGKYYVGLGDNPNLPGIISGPFDGARPVLEGQTLYVFDHNYGLVKVD